MTAHESFLSAAEQYRGGNRQRWEATMSGMTNEDGGDVAFSRIVRLLSSEFPHLPLEGIYVIVGQVNAFLL